MNSTMTTLMNVLNMRGSGGSGSSGIPSSIAAPEDTSPVPFINQGQTSSLGSSIGGTIGGVLGSLIPGFGGLGASLGSAFGGHFATGGDVQAGMAYDVGEMGRETFVPTQNGRIIPNSQLRRGGSPTIHVDARGSGDPAQVEAAVHRGILQAAPHIVHASMTTQHESYARTPSMRRG